jgi:AraC-like DNA-binding protein
MSRKPYGELSAMDREVVETIRQLRIDHGARAVSAELELPKIMHDILRSYHGNVKLRLDVISRALGCTMRTLERAFVAQYSETMNSFRERIRLEYAEKLLRSDPDVKLMSIAAELGYDRESEFNRFFRRKKGVSLTEFVRTLRSAQQEPINTSDSD